MAGEPVWQENPCAKSVPSRSGATMDPKLKYKSEARNPCLPAGEFQNKDVKP